jgi:hypothetical protein
MAVVMSMSLHVRLQIAVVAAATTYRELYARDSLSANERGMEIRLVSMMIRRYPRSTDTYPTPLPRSHT